MTVKLLIKLILFFYIILGKLHALKLELMCLLEIVMGLESCQFLDKKIICLSWLQLLMSYLCQILDSKSTR